MSRTLINLLLDTLLLILFLALMTTAVIVRFVFPPGEESAGWRLWGYRFREWTHFQFVLTAILALGILVHVMLHWSWICGAIAARVSREKKGKVDDGLQTIYGVSLMIVLINIVGLTIAAAAICIRQSP